ncbi:two-component sensor histidine kinase [Candidatus Pantoea deserta]|uniref:histidine kinase n=1 Tax=Candidatus Pantoea deserta TaxID=1869313 RepID=A0A3N4NHL5_9GAMM|nr:ATP-binding protein [Pantoea deserta]RPD95902.1 two-component sensor histidine kinase [Pantoea deserta]
MKNSNKKTLWRWISLRITLLTACMIVVIALGMWATYLIQYFWITRHLSPEISRELALLMQNPESNPVRLHQILDAAWGIRASLPNIAAPDFLWLGMHVVVTIPIVVIISLRTAKPLSEQFSNLKSIAELVAKGDFTARAALVRRSPEELIQFAQIFNKMVAQLEIYERELKASHVAAAHELRSPLTAAIGRLKGMLDNVFERDEKQLSMVMLQLKNLSRLTDDLHFLSLADAGHLALEIKEIDILALIDERVSWLRPKFAAAELMVSITSKSPCYVQADAFRMGQVFNALFENAIRYCGKGCSLKVHISRFDDHVEISFLDDGPGVPTDFLPKMYDRFTRNDTSRSRNSGGSGLGLSIANAICHAHNGKITSRLPAAKGLLTLIHLPINQAVK